MVQKGGNACLGLKKPNKKHKPRTCKMDGCLHPAMCKGHAGRALCQFSISEQQRTLGEFFYSVIVRVVSKLIVCQVCAQ